jgi:regulator of cell morphogenesis and NO signaling
MSEESHPTISVLLGQDHRRLEQVWERFLKGLESDDLESIRAEFAVFEAGLRRHIRVEEDALFPAFEQATGMSGGGPTAVMRSEHREIKAILDTLAAQVRAGDCNSVRQTLVVAQPAALLERHDAKEENILYPMSDQSITGESRAAVMAAIRSLAE